MVSSQPCAVTNVALNVRVRASQWKRVGGVASAPISILPDTAFCTVSRSQDRRCHVGGATIFTPAKFISPRHSPQTSRPLYLVSVLGAGCGDKDWLGKRGWIRQTGNTSHRRFAQLRQDISRRE
jgi:hypothetical protein